MSEKSHGGHNHRREKEPSVIIESDKSYSVTAFALRALLAEKQINALAELAKKKAIFSPKKFILDTIVTLATGYKPQENVGAERLYADIKKAINRHDKEKPSRSPGS